MARKKNEMKAKEPVKLRFKKQTELFGILLKNDKK